MEDPAAQDHSQLKWSMLLLGIGLMAGVDEIVFHQILSWHHFYDRSTSDIALLSDGLLHAAELVAIIAGFFMYADLRNRVRIRASLAWGWFLIGAGGFQVFDGIVDHKILNVHEIRYGVEILPYDLAWNGFGLLLITVGIVLVRRDSSDSRAYRTDSRASE